VRVCVRTVAGCDSAQSEAIGSSSSWPSERMRHQRSGPWWRRQTLSTDTQRELQKALDLISCRRLRRSATGHTSDWYCRRHRRRWVTLCLQWSPLRTVSVQWRPCWLKSAMLSIPTPALTNPLPSLPQLLVSALPRVQWNKIKQLATVETWRYKFAEKLYFIAAVRMRWNEKKSFFNGCFSLSYFYFYFSHMSP